MKAMWVAFSSHLFVISCLLLAYGFRRGTQRLFIMLCGSVPLVDALLVTLWVSAAHLGVVLLTVSGTLILVGGGLSFHTRERNNRVI